MKLIKTFAFFTFLFVATTVVAQNPNAKWPAMKSYEEVITRIQNGVSQGNIQSINGFSTTLQSFSDQLTNAPAKYDTKKIKQAVSKLQAQTTSLTTKANANPTDDALKPMFTELYAQYKVVAEIVESIK